MSKRRRKDLDEVLKSVNEEVARLPDPVLLRLKPALNKAQKKLEKAFDEWLSTTPPETIYTPKEYYRALSFFDEFFDEVDVIEEKTRKGLSKEALIVALAIAAHLGLEKERLSGKPSPKIKVRTPSLLRASANLRAWSINTKKDIRRRLSLGMLQGVTVERAVKRFAGKRLLNAPLPDLAKPAANLTWSGVRYSITRVVNTEINVMYNQQKLVHVLEMSKKDPTLRLIWDAVVDARTCTQCGLLHGKTVVPGEEFDDGVTEPPLHPFCRCAVLMWSTDWE